jgi:hypothetical protein
MLDMAASDITLYDEADHHQDYPANEDYWHSTCYTFTGESEGYDILLMTRIDIIRVYNAKGQWIHPGENLEHETTLIVVPSSQRGKGMEDHDFVHSGHYFAQRLDLSELILTPGEAAVIWEVPGRTHTCRPPIWELKGSHAGVDLDLTFRQMPPSWWTLGSFQNAKTSNTGGYDAPCSIEGSITVAGRTFQLKNAYGIREHMVVGRKTDIIGYLPPPDRLYWDYLVSDDITLYFFQYPLPGIYRGFVRAFGEEFAFIPKEGKGDIKHTILEYWNDPRSGLALASRWHLAMSSASGVLYIEISAHGRSFFHWVMTTGLRVEIWQIGVANGKFMAADGRTVEIKDKLICIDPLYTIGHAEQSIKSLPEIA